MTFLLTSDGIGQIKSLYLSREDLDVMSCSTSNCLFIVSICKEKIFYQLVQTSSK